MQGLLETFIAKFSMIDLITDSLIHYKTELSLSTTIICCFYAKDGPRWQG